MQSGQKISLEYHEEMRGFYGTFKGAGLAWLEALQNFKGAAEQGQTLKKTTSRHRHPWGKKETQNRKGPGVTERMQRWNIEMKP